MSEPLHNPRCRARHLGTWAIQPSFLSAALAEIRAGTWKPRAEWDDHDGAPAVREDPLYTVTPAGVAVVAITGPMLKGWSKFAECDTLRVRAAVREAENDANVRALLLVVDSPGGSVPGTQELADEVYAVRQRGAKPIHAFADDCCCSAAYWVASQASRLTVNGPGIVGSIGVMAVLHDTSKAAEESGVEVHVIATGPMKGQGVDGKPVTPEVLAEMQGLVDATAEHFFASIQRGRSALAGAEAIRAVATGQVWMGKAAQSLGLVDAVGTMQEAHDGLVAEADRLEAQRRAVEARRIAARSISRG